jgi:hypothetical protein
MLFSPHTSRVIRFPSCQYCGAVETSAQVDTSVLQLFHQEAETGRSLKNGWQPKFLPTSDLFPSGGAEAEAPSGTVVDLELLYFLGFFIAQKQ